MSGFWNRIRLLWRRFWRKPKTGTAPATEKFPAPDKGQPEGQSIATEPEPGSAAAPQIPEPAPIISESRSRKLHALERARRRHDKFVKPKGKRPKRDRVPRSPQAIQTASPLDDEPVAVGDFTDEEIIADEWMEGDGKGDVLYRQSEFYGEFNFRDTILDQLDRYWVYLERMRKHDPSAYIMYSKLGATLVPYSATFSNRIVDRDHLIRDDLEEYKTAIKLPSWFKQHWPAFGCIAVGTNPMDEAQELQAPDKNDRILWIVKFLYFQKYQKCPWYVQPVRGGHLYEMTIYWDRPLDRNYRRKYGVPEQYFIWISDDGSTMRALKTRVRPRGGFRAPWDWVLPFGVEPEERKRGFTPQIILARKFCDAAKMVEGASYAMCRVEVSKGDLTATFGVDPRRMAYFFRDRDINLTEGGATKPIFHIVKPHKRVDGAVVPMHFRGLKQFTWADYRVSITVPGRDHFMLAEWDVGAEALPKHGRWSKEQLNAGQVADRLKQGMKRGLGGHSR